MKVNSSYQAIYKMRKKDNNTVKRVVKFFITTFIALFVLFNTQELKAIVTDYNHASSRIGVFFTFSDARLNIPVHSQFQYEEPSKSDLQPIHKSLGLDARFNLQTKLNIISKQ